MLCNSGAILSLMQCILIAMNSRLTP